MAGVSSLAVILNVSEQEFYFYNGETGRDYNIKSMGKLIENIWVPWIGSQEEAFKVLKFTAVDSRPFHFFLYQDYWNPPGVSPIKVSYENPFNYNDPNDLAPGDATGGGSKILTIYESGPDIKINFTNM